MKNSILALTYSFLTIATLGVAHEHSPDKAIVVVRYTVENAGSFGTKRLTINFRDEKQDLDFVIKPSRRLITYTVTAGEYFVSKIGSGAPTLQNRKKLSPENKVIISAGAVNYIGDYYLGEDLMILTSEHTVKSLRQLSRKKELHRFPLYLVSTSTPPRRLLWSNESNGLGGSRLTPEEIPGRADNG